MICLQRIFMIDLTVKYVDDMICVQCVITVDHLNIG